MYVADFETTTNKKDCRVWAWGLCEIGHPANFEYGNTIETFMRRMKELAKARETVYFHNLKFDGEFILYWLFKNGYSHIVDKKEKTNCTFTTLISDKGQFYSMEIYFKVYKTKSHKIKFLDSLKVLPLSVAEIARGFDLPVQKLELDYIADREPGHTLTIDEISYLRNDCEIVARALDILFKQDLKRMTTAANALSDYKQIIGMRNFERWFPVPEYDADVRQSYRGGFTYVNPRYQNRVLGAGIVLDVNSLYPSVMYFKPLPYGDPIYFTGKYKPDKLYNLYVQMLVCNFRLKPNHIPTIQLKHNIAFSPTEYVTDSAGEDVVLCLTSVDLELFLSHYDVYNVEYISGWKFKSSTILFTQYIDKWYAVKQKATIDGNKPLRLISKLQLNSLYGKYGTAPKCRSKIPVFDYHADVVRYQYGEWEERKPIYIPVATFITAWARFITISAAQTVYDRFIYADTDSLHLIGTDIPPELDIDPVRLGAWKHESTFSKAKFIRAKSYLEEIDGKINVTCAGLPAAIHNQVTFENFTESAIYTGKLKPTRVSGGVVLEETNFTLKKGK